MGEKEYWYDGHKASVGITRCGHCDSETNPIPDTEGRVHTQSCCECHKEFCNKDCISDHSELECEVWCRRNSLEFSQQHQTLHSNSESDERDSELQTTTTTTTTNNNNNTNTNNININIDNNNNDNNNNDNNNNDSNNND